LKRFVKLAISPLPGEKNGIKTGRTSSIAVKGVEGISCSKFILLTKSQKKALNEEGFL